MNYSNIGDYVPGSDLRPNYKIPRHTNPRLTTTTMMSYESPMNWGPIATELGPTGLMGPWPSQTYQAYQPIMTTPAVITAPPIYNVTNLKRRLEKETPKNIKSANTFKESFADLSDPSLPKELTCLFQPLYCKLCQTHLNSNSNAKLHYKSKNHEKKVKKFLIEHAEKTGEPLHKRAMMAAANIKDDDPKYSYCQTCDLQLTSKMHAEQHYMGRNHQKAIIKAKPPAGGGYYGDDGKWIRTLKPPADATGRNGIGLTFAKPSEFVAKEEKSNKSKFFCDLCNVSTTSAEHLQMHINGQKHQKMVKKCGGQTAIEYADPLQDLEPIPRQGPMPQDNILTSVIRNDAERKDYSVYRTPSGWYYCQPCNLTLNSEAQFVQHLDSKKHQKNKSAQK